MPVPAIGMRFEPGYFIENRDESASNDEKCRQGVEKEVVAWKYHPS